MESKTIYCGSGKKMGDNWLKITISPDKIRDHIQEYEGNKFIKLNVNIKEEKDKYGKDVSVSIDTFVPEKQDESNDNELPF